MSRWTEIKSLERWKPYNESSAALRIFNKYDTELRRCMSAYYSAKAYTYEHLKSDGAVWEDCAQKYLFTKGNTKLTLKDWSDGFNIFDNWTRLNTIMATCSYFETFLSSIIIESIESDPGILFGVPHAIDGIKLLKSNRPLKENEFVQKITDCTKGDWNSRISGIKRLYPGIPKKCFDNHLSGLERIRKLRNDVAHAFGRDIEASRNYKAITIAPMHSISSEKCTKYRTIMTDIAKNFNDYLMNNHIGNFEPLQYYHKIYPEIENLNKGVKMMRLKKSMGQKGLGIISKDFCRQLILYYEGL